MRSSVGPIPGQTLRVGWDGLDEWQALILGWYVRSFEELKVFHYRITGNATGPLKSKIEQGYGAFYMGYHPLYTFARGIRHFVTWPFIIGGIGMIVGHLVAWLQGREYLLSPSTIRYVHRVQLRQLYGLVVGKRIYKTDIMV